MASPSGRMRGIPWLFGGLLLIAALLPYGNALRCGFTYDDTGIVLENPALSAAAPWWAPLTRPYWPEPHQAGLYRPLTLASYRLQHVLTGPDATAFHLVNLLLHAAVTLLAFATARRLLGRERLAFSIALLYAVHPLHTEAVTGIVGRAELLAALCGLGGYLAWIRGNRRESFGTPFLAGLGFALAAASKESAVGWLLLLAAHRAGLLPGAAGYGALRRGQRLRVGLKLDLAVLAGIAAYLAARLAVLGTLVGLRDVTAIENPLVTAPAAQRILTACKILGESVWLHLWPSRLCADYSFDSIRLESSPIGAGGLIVLLAFALLGAAVKLRRRAPVLIWCLALAVALYLPVSNLVFPIGTIMAERLWYLPSLGVLGALTWAAVALARRLRLARALPWILAFLLLLLAGRTWQRNRDWRDDRALFAAALEIVPDNVKARVNLASSLVRAERADEAEPHYAHALVILPDYLPALTGQGHLRILAGRLAEAESLLSRAVRLYPASRDAWTRLGNLLLELGRGTAALTAFERVLALQPADAAGWTGKASALFMLERYADSADAWSRALELAPEPAQLRPHAASAARRAGRLRQAEAWLSTQLAEDPENAALLGELAELRLARDDRGADALRIARAAVARAPTKRHLETLLRHLLLRDRCDEARAVLSSDASAKLAEDARDALRVLVDERCVSR